MKADLSACCAEDDENFLFGGHFYVDVMRRGLRMLNEEDGILPCRVLGTSYTF